MCRVFEYYYYVIKYFSNLSLNYFCANLFLFFYEFGYWNWPRFALLLCIGPWQEDEDEILSLPNVTFAPQDVTPVDFDPKIGVQGLGYCGLDPGLALLGQGNTEHFDLFKPVSVKRGGVAQKNSRVGGVLDKIWFIFVLIFIQMRSVFIQSVSLDLWFVGIWN